MLLPLLHPCLSCPQTRQALGVSSSSFQPISLDRYQHALTDADKFAEWLSDYHGHVQDLRGALQGEWEG